jgi:hypothetical protein
MFPLPPSESPGEFESQGIREVTSKNLTQKNFKNAQLLAGEKVVAMDDWNLDHTLHFFYNN